MAVDTSEFPNENHVFYPSVLFECHERMFLLIYWIYINTLKYIFSLLILKDIIILYHLYEFFFFFFGIWPCQCLQISQSLAYLWVQEGNEEKIYNCLLITLKQVEKMWTNCSKIDTYHFKCVWTLVTCMLILYLKMIFIY